MGAPWGGPEKCESCEEWTAGDGAEETPAHLEALEQELPGYCIGCLQIAFDDENSL